MEQSLKEMKKNIERIVEDRRQNLEAIKHQRQRFHADIKETRAKINNHLDKLEQEIKQDIQAAEQKVISQINRFVQKVSDHGKTIDELQKNITATKRFATDLQTFFGGKMFESKIQKEEKFMMSLIEDGCLQQLNLQWRMDAKMSDILSMTKISEISVIPKPSTISVTTDREKQAQQMIPKIPKTINEIQLTLLKQIEIQKGKTELESQVVLSCLLIKTSNQCYGITNEKGRLLYYEVGRGIQTADVNSGSTVTTVVKVDGEHIWNYVTTSNDRIYHTINKSNTVTCYTVTGHKVWEYKDESILKSVHGVAVDNDSNVYVVSMGITVSSYFHQMESTRVDC
ncbi:unnamed protein product [Mytilus edulis]|uniref:Uncharacterized protein n=1 Tax=Mytilus edulis TaxID=6550 RepID=A0A8S3SIU3_MYTED|nr:unnamed protein product [Mytilus edulis]